MTHQDQSNNTIEAVQLLADNGFEGMAQAMQLLINEAMQIERAAYLGAEPYERSENRKSHANGFKTKTLNSRIGQLELQVPQTRDCQFYPSALERGERSERALKLAVAEMYVQGVSTRKVAKITAQLCGLEITSTQVSRAAARLDEELEKWRNRALGQVEYLILDARYEKVRVDGTVRDCAVLIAIGVLPSGQRSVLGVSVSLSEAEVHWRDFLQSLCQRGVQGVKFVVSDDHSGLKAARKAVLPAVPWQRCQFHLAQNAMQHTPKVSMRKQVLTTSETSSTPKTLPMLRWNSIASTIPTKTQHPNWPTGPKTISPNRSPSFSFPENIKNECELPTCSNDKTRRSNDEPESPHSSPTKIPS